MSRRVAESQPRRKASDMSEILLPLVAEAEHQRSVLPFPDFILCKAICLVLGEGNVRIPLRNAKQVRGAHLEGSETGKMEGSAEIGGISNREKFWQNSGPKAERVRAANVVSDVLHLYAVRVLRNGCRIGPANECTTDFNLRP